MARTPFQRLLEEKGLTQSALAARLGVNKSTVALWVLRRIPAERVTEIERETGIPRHELRPDLWSPPQEAAQ
jgi:DNA-binding transcriptional regulator YdaS (Cro superfamily)